jgi:hypothetical protein
MSSSVCSEETEINELESTIEAVDAAGISLVIAENRAVILNLVREYPD